MPMVATGGRGLKIDTEIGEMRYVMAFGKEGVGGGIEIIWYCLTEGFSGSSSSSLLVCMPVKRERHKNLNIPENIYRQP